MILSKNAIKKESKRIANISEDQLDFTDIPETDEEFWKNAEIKLPETKQRITIRLDSEIIEYFKDHYDNYQTYINSVLKAYIHAHKK